MAGTEEAPTAASLPRIQSHVQQFWDAHGVPARCLEGPAQGPIFRFTEGPPTANGRPHIGHVLARALKDTILRYRRMRGDRILSSMAGWDCHGLGVEIEIEKKHGFRSKREIESYGIEKFCEECRAGAFEVEGVWLEMSRRMGYWLDYEHPYQTMSPPYIESVWWALKELQLRGLLTKGHYCLPYCPRCETPLSSHEVAQGYHEATDPSVTIRLPLQGPAGSPPRSVLVWTTTPWTLPSNQLVAARGNLIYVGVAGEGGELILAEAALARYFPGGSPTVLHRYLGRELAGLTYDPPFPFAGPGPHKYRVVLDDSVDPKEGTGFVHIAPSFGPEDQRIGEREGVEFHDPLDSRGIFSDEVPPVAGKHFKAADPILVEALRANGRLFRAETIKHTYPFCWRCDSALIYRAVDSWFVRTSHFTTKLVANNQAVQWTPAHLKDGRFGNFLGEAKDWALSRNRYWGTPLPIWTCPKHHHVCVGSFPELAQLAGVPLPRPFDPHRVTVDRITFPCPSCGGTMQREPYTIDAWFDSGAAPFAQYHYPFETGPFDPTEPLDYVAEGLDQTRGWFYTMLVISTALFDRPAYRAAIASGLVLDDQGRKMSKSKGNAIEPLGLLERLGGDAVRWGFFVVDYTEPMRLSEDSFRLASQRTLGTLLNVLEFYRQNAPPGFVPRRTGDTEPVLDRWLASRLREVELAVTDALDRYDHHAGALAIQAFVSDLSTWYLRRSRPRFWDEAVTAERTAASAALGRTLLELARVIAPFAPFTAEAIYQEVSGQRFGVGTESVHLQAWPKPGPADPVLLESMEDLRAWVEVGRELRQRAQVKARVPLPTLVLRADSNAPFRRLGAEGERLLADELNVRELQFEPAASQAKYAEADWVAAVDGPRRAILSRKPTPELLEEGLAREAMRRLQSARKEMGLAFSDHIRLELWADADLEHALRARLDTLRTELLADDVQLALVPEGGAPEVTTWTFDQHTLAARLVRTASLAS
jgi:isoleucyl-tRNA synthetase